MTELMVNLIKLARLGLPMPDYTTLCRRQKTLTVNPAGRPCSDSLHPLIDSTGIEMMDEVEWKKRYRGASYRRRWRKEHQLEGQPRAERF